MFWIDKANMINWLMLQCYIYISLIELYNLYHLTLDPLFRSKRGTLFASKYSGGRALSEFLYQGISSGPEVFSRMITTSKIDNRSFSIWCYERICSVYKLKHLSSNTPIVPPTPIKAASDPFFILSIFADNCSSRTFMIERDERKCTYLENSYSTFDKLQKRINRTIS